MKIPLHLSPNDTSLEADAKRVELHIGMAALNPKGFRQATKRSAPTRVERMAERVYNR